jgi:hypothetical protein
LVIDLSKMRGVTVDAAKKTVQAQEGALWEDVDLAAAKYGKDNRAAKVSYPRHFPKSIWVDLHASKHYSPGVSRSKAYCLFADETLSQVHSSSQTSNC